MIICDDPNTRSGEGDISLPTLAQARQEVRAGELVLSGSGLEAVTMGSVCNSSPWHSVGLPLQAECCVSFQTSPERLSSSYL